MPWSFKATTTQLDLPGGMFGELDSHCTTFLLVALSAESVDLSDHYHLRSSAISIEIYLLFSSCAGYRVELEREIVNHPKRVSRVKCAPLISRAQRVPCEIILKQQSICSRSCVVGGWINGRNGWKWEYNNNNNRVQVCHEPSDLGKFYRERTRRIMTTVAGSMLTRQRSVQGEAVATAFE